ncbi:MAG: diaminopimelate decarboxylase, partial [Clostridia bacterium]|nr:diaminopimelate decarboxylase [Clostridia bacterium]
FPTPFHLYSEEKLRKRVRAFLKAFSWNKRFTEYYAVKACPTPGIIKILQEEGCGVDCASECELMLAEAMGFEGEKIMFSSNETPAGEFAYASKLGAIINLDDYSLIPSLLNEGSVPERICLRFNPGGEFKLGTFVMGNPGDAKYGMTYEQLRSAIIDLTKLGVKEFALHAFLASNTTDSSYYPTMARLLMNTAVSLKNETGAQFFMINLSGGIGIPYMPGQEEADIEKIGNGVREAYEEICVPNGLQDIKIASELGRYITGPVGWLVTSAIHEKHIHKEYIGVDACSADLMRPAMYGAYHHITIAGRENEACTHKYDVVGSLCENNDKFAIDRMLPKVNMGDIIVIHDTGAHGRSMGYNYNGRLRSAEVLVRENGEIELIRRAETAKDYFATLDFTGVLDGVLSHSK